MEVVDAEELAALDGNAYSAEFAGAGSSRAATAVLPASHSPPPAPLFPPRRTDGAGCRPLPHGRQGTGKD
uniref:Uncharacterized protein n=1 Tax=Oryza nivara TaxID=4536 RepID=A0A0E0J312_ORYNI